MIGFKVVNLDLLLQVKSEEQIRTILNDFESPLNPDIENFLKYKAVLKEYHIAAPLIGQLGKNYKYKELITGDELLTMAVDMLRHVQSLVGGKFIYLECENNEKLIGFYIRNGFKVFGERSLDIDEQDFAGHVLIQLLKYL